jgi:hypothetical protein
MPSILAAQYELGVSRTVPSTRTQRQQPLYPTPCDEPVWLECCTTLVCSRFSLNN